MMHDHLTVGKLMIEDVRTVSPQDSVVRAAQILVQYRIRHLVVAESTGKVVGVLSERQVLKHLSPWLSRVEEARKPPSAPPSREVQQIMAAPAITIKADVPLHKAAAILGSKKVGCLPVVKDGERLVGIITAVDVLKFVGDYRRLALPEEEIKVFRPPAFLSDDSQLTIPRGYCAELTAGDEVLALLAYATRTKRIGVKLLTRSHLQEDRLGARPVAFTTEHIVIPAKDFLQYHHLDIRGTLDVVRDRHNGYLFLSPVVKS